MTYIRERLTPGEKKVPCMRGINPGDQFGSTITLNGADQLRDNWGDFGMSGAEDNEVINTIDPPGLGLMTVDTIETQISTEEETFFAKWLEITEKSRKL